MVGKSLALMSVMDLLTVVFGVVVAVAVVLRILARDEILLLEVVAASFFVRVEAVVGRREVVISVRSSVGVSCRCRLVGRRLVVRVVCVVVVVVVVVVVFGVVVLVVVLVFVLVVRCVLGRLRQVVVATVIFFRFGICQLLCLFECFLFLVLSCMCFFLCLVSNCRCCSY